jgi:hypothetical protein
MPGFVDYLRMAMGWWSGFESTTPEPGGISTKLKVTNTITTPLRCSNTISSTLKVTNTISTPLPIR